MNAGGSFPLLPFSHKCNVSEGQYNAEDSKPDSYTVYVCLKKLAVITYEITCECKYADPYTRACSGEADKWYHPHSGNSCGKRYILADARQQPAYKSAYMSMPVEEMFCPVQRSLRYKNILAIFIEKWSSYFDRDPVIEKCPQYAACNSGNNYNKKIHLSFVSQVSCRRNNSLAGKGEKRGFKEH